MKQYSWPVSWPKCTLTNPCTCAKSKLPTTVRAEDDRRGRAPPAGVGTWKSQGDLGLHVPAKSTGPSLSCGHVDDALRAPANAMDNSTSFPPPPTSTTSPQPCTTMFISP